MLSTGADNHVGSCLQTMFTNAQKQKYLLKINVHVLRVVGPHFRLGFFAQSFWLEMEEPMDNSQSIMSDDSTHHSSQYSWPTYFMVI